MRLALCGGGDCEAAVLSHGLHYGYAFRRPPHPQTEEEQDEPEIALSRDRPGDGRFCLTGGLGPNGTATGATRATAPDRHDASGHQSDVRPADRDRRDHEVASADRSAPARPVARRASGAYGEAAFSRRSQPFPTWPPCNRKLLKPSRNCKRMHLRLRWRSSWC